MSIITCLIIFSGSSARSIMSFRLARIKVLTLSKSPMTFLLSNGRKLLLPKRNKNFKATTRRHKTLLGAGLMQMPSQQMQEGGNISKAERRHLLRQVDRSSQEMPGGESNHHGAEDPEQQEFVFPRHGHPPTAIKRPGGLVRAHRGRKRTLRLGRGCYWLLGLRCFVADQTHLAEQVRHLHAGERFEERRNLRGNLRDVTGQLLSAGCIAISRRDDGDFVDFAERLGKSAHDFRQTADEFVHHGGL